MNNLLAKLNKIEFNKYENNELTSQDGWSVSYRVELNGHFESQFQVIVRITYKGEFVSSYGCVEPSDSIDFGKWFLTQKAIVREKEYQRADTIAQCGKALLNAL